MRSIITLFIRRQEPVDQVKLDLLDQMQIAMRGFTQALQKYQHNTVDAGVAYSQMLFAEVEMYRENYFTARKEYEKLYGNLSHYNEKLDMLQEWMKERNPLCLFRHPNESYTSDKQIS